MIANVLALKNTCVKMQVHLAADRK